jgi:hypothetical protein
MPTILLISGWRIFFYSNEGNEPMHIHAEKAEMECKFWIDEINYEIVEALSYSMNPVHKNQIRRILYEHLDYIISEWKNYFKV